MQQETQSHGAHYCQKHNAHYRGWGQALQQQEEYGVATSWALPAVRPGTPAVVAPSAAPSYCQRKARAKHKKLQLR